MQEIHAMSIDAITEPETQTSLKVAQINAPSYQPRLGLARVLRALNEPNEAKKYYFQVMDMAPEVSHVYHVFSPFLNHITAILR